MSDNAILAATRCMGISKYEMSGDGFRAMGRTILDEVLGFRPHFIEHQFGRAARACSRTVFLCPRSWAVKIDFTFVDAACADITGASGTPARRSRDYNAPSASRSRRNAAASVKCSAAIPSRRAASTFAGESSMNTVRSGTSA